MSEPFVLFNINGEEVVLFSPQVAKILLNNGELFEAPPLVIEEAVDEEE